MKGWRNQDKLDSRVNANCFLSPIGLTVASSLAGQSKPEWGRLSVRLRSLTFAILRSGRAANEKVVMDNKRTKALTHLNRRHVWIKSLAINYVARVLFPHISRLLRIRDAIAPQTLLAVLRRESSAVLVQIASKIFPSRQRY